MLPHCMNTKLQLKVNTASLHISAKSRGLLQEEMSLHQTKSRSAPHREQVPRLALMDVAYLRPTKDACTSLLRSMATKSALELGTSRKDRALHRQLTLLVAGETLAPEFAMNSAVARSR
jgi:hypothetical protein